MAGKIVGVLDKKEMAQDSTSNDDHRDGGRANAVENTPCVDGEAMAAEDNVKSTTPNLASSTDPCGIGGFYR
jgi:hypothetical protein